MIKCNTIWCNTNDYLLVANNKYYCFSCYFTREEKEETT